jgi:hypothetical protein
MIPVTGNSFGRTERGCRDVGTVSRRTGGGGRDRGAGRLPPARFGEVVAPWPR